MAEATAPVRVIDGAWVTGHGVPRPILFLGMLVPFIARAGLRRRRERRPAEPARRRLSRPVGGTEGYFCRVACTRRIRDSRFMTPAPVPALRTHVVDRYARALGTVGLPSLRLLTIVAPLVMMVFLSLSWPIFATPEAIGTDSSTYFAAGLRLNEGNPLYTLTPGDRPVPLDPPYWSIPLMSPPPIAVL